MGRSPRTRPVRRRRTRPNGPYLIAAWTFDDRTSLQRAAWCRDHDVDGVDVDWEAVKAAQRDSYSKFVADLAEALHRDDRMIAGDVCPKASEPGCWSGPRAQDWKALGRTVDQFRVMTCNYSGSWSGPGPLSPPAWMDRILDFAETQVTPRKIVMGVGLYARDWRGSRTTDLLWTDVERIRAADDQRETRGSSAELSLAYRRGGARHIAFFPGACTEARARQPRPNARQSSGGSPSQ